MSDNENKTSPSREKVREVVEKSAAIMLSSMVGSVDRGNKYYIKQEYMPVWAAYYSILAADDQEAIMQEQRQLARDQRELAQDQQRMTRSMRWHSRVMLVLSIAMLIMTGGIVVLTILLLRK